MKRSARSGLGSGAARLEDMSWGGLVQPLHDETSHLACYQENATPFFLCAPQSVADF